jgi:hypothetical protein
MAAGFSDKSGGDGTSPDNPGRRQSHFKTAALNHSATLPTQQHQWVSDTPTANTLATNCYRVPVWSQPAIRAHSSRSFRKVSRPRIQSAPTLPSAFLTGCIDAGIKIDATNRPCRLLVEAVQRPGIRRQLNKH